ncbi:MAG: DUF4386 domain-containing protein [Bacteroidota bacterium]|nr:DUF4386 domain-containing protein [Bacteroidota bacterium]
MEQQQLIKTARFTGASYLALAVSGILGFMVFHPKVFVGADPQQTLRNLTTHGTVAKTRLLFELLIIVSQALAAIGFYRLFADIHRLAATAILSWGTVNAVIISVSAIAMNTAIDYAVVATATEAEKLDSIQVLTLIITNAWAIGGIFFGLWLIPMGWVVVKSRRMPLWLGRILIIGGIGYILQTFLHAAGLTGMYIGLLTVPATIGELWIIAYLLSFGIRPVTGKRE